MNKDQIEALQMIYNLNGIPFVFIGYDGKIHYSMPESFGGCFKENMMVEPPDQLKDSDHPEGLTLLEMGVMTNVIICKLDEKGYLLTAPVCSTEKGEVNIKLIEYALKENKVSEYLQIVKKIPVMSVYNLIDYASMIKYIYSGIIPEGLNYYFTRENADGILYRNEERTKKDLGYYEEPSNHPHIAEEKSKKLFEAIRQGDSNQLKSAISDFYIGKTGQLSQDPLWQSRYTFVLDLDQAVRTAIDVGADREYCLDLFDSFCQKLDFIYTGNDVERLRVESLVTVCNVVKETLQNSNYGIYTRQALSYVKMHIKEHLSVQEIAYAIGINRNLLANQFIKDIGISLADYIVEEKLEYSKELLKRKDMSVADAAFQLSFSSHSHYSKLFREKYHMTPKQYQKQYGGNL